jgi:hypothetical protein
MTFEERRTTVVRDTDPAATATTHVHEEPVRVDLVGGERVVASSEIGTVRPSTATMVARLVALTFGIIQLVIGLRIVFLALNAREGNGLVASILELSRPLVAPFEGIFQTNALQAGVAVLDVAAVAALVGWTILELIILGLIRVPRPGEDV